MAKTDGNSGERTRDGIVRALKRELAGYVADGNTARADEVRAELERIGAGEPARPIVEREILEAPETATPVRKRASRPKPKGA